MKRVFLLGVLFFMLAMVGLSARDWLELEAGAALFMPADAGFKKVYGDQYILPEFSLAVRPWPFLSLGGSVSMLNKSATLTEIDESFTNRQWFLGFGLAFNLDLSKKFGWRIGGGGLVVSYHEEAFNEIIDGSKLGYYAETAFSYRLSKLFYMVIKGRYARATELIEKKENVIEGTKILGGFYGGLALGVTF